MTRARSATPRRYLALWFPFLSADRWRLQQTQSRSAVSAEPRIFAERLGNALRIGAVDDAAHRLGLRPGLPLADARARFGGLDIVEMDRGADARLLRILAKAASRYSPSVAIDSLDGLVLDITGCAHLFGGEAAMLLEMAASLVSKGMTPRGAIAGTADAAQAVARYSDGGVITAGYEAKAVTDFPVAALRLDEDAVRKLIHLGLKTIGDLMRRSRKPLAARFGAALLDRLDRVCGARDIPPPALRAMPLCWTERRFAEPIAHAVSIAQALLDLATHLSRQMEEQGLGGRSFEVRFFRADGAQRRIAVRTSTATREPERICKLFAERLETLNDPLSSGFGFDLIRLAIIRHEPLQFTEAALAAPCHDSAKADRIVDQLAARLGDARVLRLAPGDSHDPACASNLVSALEAQTNLWSENRDGMSRPLTLFDPPQLIEAFLPEAPDGAPYRFRWRRRINRVVWSEGPERIAPEWWQALETLQDYGSARDRDYFQVEDLGGRRYWLYREGLLGDPDKPVRWFLHGLTP